MFRYTLLISLAALLVGPMIAAAQIGVAPPRSGVKLQPRIQFTPKPKSPPAGIKVQTAPPQPRQPSTQLNKPSQPPPVRPEDILRMIPGLLPQENRKDSNGEPRRYYQDSSPSRVRSAAPSKPAAPSAAQLEALSAEQLRRLLQAAAESLDQELSAIRGGDGWRKHLETETLKRLLATEQLAPLDDDTTGILRKIAERLEQTAGQSEYRVIAEKDGFATLRAGLKEYLKPPQARAMRGLAAQVVQLDAELDQTKVGAGWKKFLMTDELTQLATKTETLDQADSDLLRKIKERFEEVERNEKYEFVKKLHGFDATHRRVDDSLAAKTLTLNPQPEPPGSPRGADELSSNDFLRKLIEEMKAAKQAERDRMAEILQGLFGAKEEPSAQRTSDEKLAASMKRLNHIVGLRPAALNPTEARILKQIAENWDKAHRSNQTESLRSLPSLAPAMAVTKKFAADYERLQAEWSRQAIEFMLPGKKPRSRSEQGVVTLMPLDDGSPEAVATLLQVTDDESQLTDGATLLQFNDDDSQPPAATILPLGVDEPPRRPSATLSDHGLAVARYGRSLSVANLNRWLDPDELPWIDKVAPNAPDGHSPGANITLVGTHFSPDKSRNSIAIMKRLADGSIGTLATLAPQIASNAGTALELKLPADIEPGNYLIRVAVELDGQSQPSNVLAVNVATPPLPPPVLTRISPNPQSAFQMLTIDGENFGDAGFIELKFQRHDTEPLPTDDAVNTKQIRTAFAQVLSDQQLVSQVPLKLAAGEYRVAANRQGRLSNWIPLTVSDGPADLAIVDFHVAQLWSYTSQAVAEKALAGNAEADKVREYWYRLRAVVKNVGSTESPGGGKLHLLAETTGDSPGSQTFGEPIELPPLAPGDVFSTGWIATPRVFLGMNLHNQFTAKLTPADANAGNDSKTKKAPRLNGDERR